MASYPLIGKKTVYIDDMVISPDYVQDEVAASPLLPALPRLLRSPALSTYRTVHTRK